MELNFTNTIVFLTVPLLCSNLAAACCPLSLVPLNLSHRVASIRGHHGGIISCWCLAGVASALWGKLSHAWGGDKGPKFPPRLALKLCLAQTLLNLSHISLQCMYYSKQFTFIIDCCVAFLTEPWVMQFSFPSHRMVKWLYFSEPLKDVMALSVGRQGFLL